MSFSREELGVLQRQQIDGDADLGEIGLDELAEQRPERVGPVAQLDLEAVDTRFGEQCLARSGS